MAFRKLGALALAVFVAHACACAESERARPEFTASEARTSPAVGAIALARGEVVDPVATLADPSQTYALYLPTAYSAEKRWPMLFVLDARGRGRLAAERFRAGAETHGWIVASSNDTRSDGPWDPNLNAFRAMLGEAEARFAVDARRLYIAGLSGNARGAWALAKAMPKAVAGVILASGGYPFESPPAADLPFSVFGTAGTRDFNYQEMQTVADRLEELSLPHRIEVFEGEHEWPPAELCGVAVAWMEIQAMKSGRRGRDDDFLTKWLEHDLKEARALEAAEKPADAFERYQSVTRDFAGLTDVSEASTAVERLTPSPAVAARRADRERIANWERKRRGEAEALVGALQSPGFVDTASLKPRIRDMIDDMKRLALGGSGDLPKARAAQRVLEHLHSFLAFYLPRALAKRGASDRAVLSLELAVMIHDESPTDWYDLACARARAGTGDRALDALETALSRGFRDLALLRGDSDLKSLREEPRFAKLVESLNEAGGP